MAISVGIDVGTRVTKVVCVEHKGKFPVSQSFAFPTPYATAGQEEKNAAAGSDTKVDGAAVWKSLLAQIPSSQMKAAVWAVSIPSARVSVMTVDLPKMSRKELAVAAVAEIKRKMVPPPTPRSIFEHVMVGEVFVGKIPRYELLVVKTEKDYVDEALKIFEKSPNVVPALVTPTCAAVPAAVPHVSKIAREDSAYIDIGYYSVAITITKKGNLFFFRDVSVGVKHITGRIAKELGVNEDEAEQIIRKHGVPEVTTDLQDKVKVAEEIMRQNYEASLSGGTGAGVNLLQLRVAWQSEIENIVHEVRRSLLYFKDQTKGGRVDNIFFLGGGAEIPGLVEEIKKDVGGNCRIFTAADVEAARATDAADSGSAFGPAYAGALALAIAAATAKTNKQLANFLPAELKQRLQSAQHRAVGIGICIAVIAGLLYQIAHVSVRNRVLMQNMALLQQEEEDQQDVLSMLEAVKRQKQVIEDKHREIQDIMKGRVITAEVLESISGLVPDGVIVTRMEVAPASEISRSQEGEGAEAGAQPGPGAGGYRGQQEPSPVAAGTSTYVMQIAAEYEGDYEETLAKIEDFKRRMEAKPHFYNVEASLPELETMTPVRDGSQPLRLTQPKRRAFGMRADVVRTNG